MYRGSLETVPSSVVLNRVSITSSDSTSSAGFYNIQLTGIGRIYLEGNYHGESGGVWILRRADFEKSFVDVTFNSSMAMVMAFQEDWMAILVIDNKPKYDKVETKYNKVEPELIRELVDQFHAEVVRQSKISNQPVRGKIMASEASVYKMISSPVAYKLGFDQETVWERAIPIHEGDIVSYCIYPLDEYGERQQSTTTLKPCDGKFSEEGQRYLAELDAILKAGGWGDLDRGVPLDDSSEEGESADNKGENTDHSFHFSPESLAEMGVSELVAGSYEEMVSADNKGKNKDPYLHPDPPTHAPTGMPIPPGVEASVTDAAGYFDEEPTRRKIRGRDPPLDPDSRLPPSPESR